MNTLDQITNDINARKERLNDIAEICKLATSGVHLMDTHKVQIGEDIAWAVAEIERLHRLIDDMCAAAGKQYQMTQQILEAGREMRGWLRDHANTPCVNKWDAVMNTKRGADAHKAGS